MQSNLQHTDNIGLKGVMTRDLLGKVLSARDNRESLPVLQRRLGLLILMKKTTVTQVPMPPIVKLLTFLILPSSSFWTKFGHRGEW